MKVFISWSGERGKELARLLRDWLPRVIQRCEPWFSEEDIPPGAIWPVEIMENLNQASFGIICVTPERLNAPWLLYEAGALALKMGMTRLVCPLLLDMRSKRLEGPLAQYQSRSASNKEQVYDLVKAINKCDGQPVLDRYLSSTFKKYWEDFDTRVREIKEMDIPRDLLAEASAQPDITFDCTQEEFVNHLSSCDEVTILGITNRSLPGCLEQAWEKRKQLHKGTWKKVEIIFPAKHLLKDMPFPGLGDGQNTLEDLNQRWETGVERARKFLRSYTNPDNTKEKRAQYVEIRSYDKPFPFVGQMFNNSKLRVAYILPDKDIRSSCYMNMQVSRPPCMSQRGRLTTFLVGENTPPCKQSNDTSFSCEACGWKDEHSPCYAILNAFKKISTASTPLLAANIIGRVKDRKDSTNLQFVFSSLRPQNNWRETLRSTVAGHKPVHLLAFVIMRVGNEVCLLLRNEHNSSGEFGLYGALPGKVNDVDFFPSMPEDRYRTRVYEMQKAWDNREADMSLSNFMAKAREASDLFVELVKIERGVPVDNSILNDACIRAAVRSIYERVGLRIRSKRLQPQEKTFLVEQGDYELFIRCFILDLEIEELEQVVNPDVHRISAEELQKLKQDSKLTDFLMKYTDDIVDMLAVNAG